jgi:hypothetical protein
MGALMTLLSFSMLARYVPMRQIKAEDLKPAAVWATLMAARSAPGPAP